MGAFKKDLASGKAGERHVAAALKKHYGARRVLWKAAGRGLDFQLEIDGALIPFEVKTDFRAAKTGNVFLEISCSDKVSGLSATTAERWAVLVPHMQLILVFCPRRMASYLRRTKRARLVNGGDRRASSGYVIPIKFLLGKNGIEIINTNTKLKK